ncbi:putative acyl-CoA synthetase YngI [Penicillium rolfsii]|nr:putative acyl-CoA synthetase YngI [Penicillium rolfsii]
MGKQTFCVEPLALVQGPPEPPLWVVNLESVLNEKAEQHHEKPAVIFPWQKQQLSFEQLRQRGQLVAASLLGAGVKHGDCVGIIAGNRYEYLEVFVGGALIGCTVLVLNNTYRPWELRHALERTECRILFLAPTIGSRSLIEHVNLLCSASSQGSLPSLSQIVFYGDSPADVTMKHQNYAEFTSSIKVDSDKWSEGGFVRQVVLPSDTLSFQLTSGTTGLPKVAMLSHLSMLNNARFVGQRLGIASTDVICCPPPLFHCFGLVMGFLASLIHGATIVFPSDHFNADAVLESVYRHQCTTLLGVPTMFIAELEALQARNDPILSLRKGLIAGSTISHTLMNRLSNSMGLSEMTIAYGMTETAPVSFMSAADDAPNKRNETVGRVMPHTQAKVINQLGEIVHRGERGELCVSGYGLQKGYLNNAAKTAEVMRFDKDGLLWMHTGDECVIDSEGYCRVTGRIKDIIIRGGENIFPAEIEDRLIAHPAVSEASVVGVRDVKYGEVVACFLKSALQPVDRPTTEEVQSWVRDVMSRSKSPEYVFWVGDGGVCEDFPTTGSGKHQKHLLREIGNKLLCC